MKRRWSRIPTFVIGMLSSIFMIGTITVFAASVLKGNGWYLVDNSYYMKVWRYDNTTLDKPDSFYSLTGWHTNNKSTEKASPDETHYGVGTGSGYNGAVSGTIYETGAKNLTTVNNGTVNLYVSWEKNHYTINYSGNNTTVNIYGDPTTTSFTGSTVSTSCFYDTNVTLAMNGFAKQGYTFKEWNTKSDGTGTSYSSGQSLTKPNFTAVDEGSVTLYAIWEPNVYNVVLNPSGGTFDSWNDAYDRYFYKVRFDQCVMRNLPSCTIANHSFIGWARYSQSIEEGRGETSPVNEFYYRGDKRIYLSANKSKQSNDVWFNPLTTRDLVVYAWYNTMPTFADVYDGLFFEGQRVSYADLIDLVSVFDYEDDYRNEAVKKIYDLPEVNQEDIYIPTHPQEGSSTPNGSSENNNVNTGMPEYKFNGDKWIDNGDGTYTEKSTGQKYYTIEKKMQLESEINASDLVIEISDISYEVVNGVKQEEGSWESIMGSVDEATWSDEGKLESDYWLDTSTRRIDKTSLFTEGMDTAYANAFGNFNITFKVTDKGIMCGGNLVVDSPVTIEYTRLCQIHYNALPQIYIRDITWYENTTDLEDISSIISNQLVLDSEDCINNPPWWYTKASDNNTGMEPKTYHGNGDKKLGVVYKTGSTYDDLQLTLKEEYVWGVVMSPYLARDYEGTDIDGAVSDWVNSGIKVADVVALKNNNTYFVGNVKCSQIYDAILSFNVCLDARDQWGKWASGKIDAMNPWNPESPDNPPVDPNNPGQPSGPDPIPDTPDPDPTNPDKGQPESKRSVTIYKVNIDQDIDLTQANVREQVRFISDKYANSIAGDGSYWGETSYGYDILRNILNAKNEAEGKTPSEYSGSYKGKNGNTVDIKVNDYTD